MKILTSVLCISTFFLLSTSCFAQVINRFSYFQLGSPINDDFPFDNGYVDLEVLNPVDFLKDKISRDTQQNWDETLQKWKTFHVDKYNFLPKCGNIQSHYEYRFDSLNREVLERSDTFIYEKNLLKSFQTFVYTNGVKQLYETAQYVFKSNLKAPDTVFVTQGGVKRRITYTFEGLYPTLIQDDELDDNQLVKSQFQYKLTYTQGLLTTYIGERKVNNTWQIENIQKYKYNDRGALENWSSFGSSSQDTIRYTYTYNDQNYLVQLENDYFNVNGWTRLLKYVFTNFNASGTAINVDIYATKETPFYKLVYDNLIDDGKIRFLTYKNKDANGNYKNAGRQRFVFCGDAGDGNGTTKVSNLNRFDVKVFPNPAQNYIKIEADLSENLPVSVTIYDAFGRLVFQAHDKKIDELISVANLNNGLYMLKIATAKQMSVVSIVIQK